MNKPIFEGSAVAIVTPFNKEGGVNFKKLEQLVDFHLQNSTDAIVVCGSTGEASTMPDEEHIATVKCVVDAVNHKVPVIAGTGSNCTETAIYLSQEAEKLGFKGVTENSLDTVSDRDYCIEFLAALSTIMMHLSRFSEEVIIWNSNEYMSFRDRVKSFDFSPCLHCEQRITLWTL